MPYLVHWHLTLVEGRVTGVVMLVTLSQAAVLRRIDAMTKLFHQRQIDKTIHFRTILS